MSNWKDDYELLGVGKFTSLITNIDVCLWGNKVKIECAYNPLNRSHYVMIFKDCREIKWDIYHPEDAREDEADLIGISLGEDEHRKPAVIHTDIFEISILYGSFSVHKGKGDEYSKQNLAVANQSDRFAEASGLRTLENAETR